MLYAVRLQYMSLTFTEYVIISSRRTRVGIGKITDNSIYVYVFFSYLCAEVQA